MAIYFIGAKTGPVKIGYSRHVNFRLKDLQVGNPYELKVLAVCEGGKDQERKFHDQFAEIRMSGEWFERTAELESLIEKISITGSEYLYAPLQCLITDESKTKLNKWAEDNHITIESAAATLLTDAINKL